MGADHVVGVLATLVDKSLVAVEPSPGDTRYRLLEVIKAFGQEQLAESGELEETRAAGIRFVAGRAVGRPALPANAPIDLIRETLYSPAGVAR